jgi:hypothetical protein
MANSTRQTGHRAGIRGDLLDLADGARQHGGADPSNGGEVRESIRASSASSSAAVIEIKDAVFSWHSPGH